MIRYRYSQEPYDCEKPFDDSNYLEILRRGEGSKKNVDKAAYEKEPLQLQVTGVDSSTHEEEPDLAKSSTSADKTVAHPL
jgi:hypothetical protein